LALTREQYLGRYKDWASHVYGTEKDERARALRQAYERNLLGFDTSRSTVQSDYTAGRNRLGELRGTTEADYTAAQNRINEQLAAQIPQYQQQRNQASAQAARDAQRLREIMAARGLFRSGSAVGREADIMNRAAGSINDITTQENLFRSAIANRLAELGASRANALSAIANRQAELEQNLANELARIAAAKELLGQQYGENEQALADTYARQLSAALMQAPLLYEDYANRLFNQDLAAMQFAQGVLSDVAQQTGQYNLPSQYKPGDILVALYRRLYEGR